MHAEYDGRQVVGIDLHRRRSVIVRMAEAGDQLGCVRIDNDPLVLAAEMAKAGEHPEVVLEATYGWYWAVDVLQDAGARVHLAHPLGVKGFAYRRVKNDLLTEQLRVTAAQNLDRHRGYGRIGDLRALAVADRSIDLEPITTGTGAFSLIPTACFSSVPLFDLDHRPGRHRRWPAHLPDRPGSTR